MKRKILASVAALSLVAAGAVQADSTTRTNISAKHVAHSASANSGSGLTAAEIMIIVTAVAVAGAVLNSSSGAAATSTTAVVSDARLKTDITRTGTSPSGIPIYSYRYGTAPELYSGVLAQDLVDLAPNAIVPLKNGYMAVDYGLIDVDFTQVD
ncbi:MAG: tail fiber domain-containing protein [Pseudomonadota bacterium]